MMRYPPLSLLTKTQFNALALKEASINIPGNTPGKFPKICKYADSCSSHNLHDLCNDEKAVEERISWMKSLEPQRDVFSQDYIFGDECSAMVIELGSETAIALTPLEYKFPQGTKDTEAFLTWENKFEGVEKGNVLYGFVTDEPRRSALQKAAVSAFKIARQGEPACWARVDMRYERTTGKVYVIEIGNPPVVFYPPGNTLGDDLVVEKTFPGAQPAFFDLLLLSRHLQLGEKSPLTELHTTSAEAARTYDSFTEFTGVTYDSIALVQPHYKAIKSFAEQFSFAGETVLDLGCGTGIFGRALDECGHSARITGVDISKGMADGEAIRKFYQAPVIIEEIQSYVMNDVHFDHVICFGTLQFLHPIEFNAVLARMFQIASKSVSFMVDEMGQVAIEKIFEQHKFKQFDLIEATKRFGVPPGWKVLKNERVNTYRSPTTGKDVFATLMHFERVDEWTPIVPQLDPETHMFMRT
jgi:ubiquinone/menaquinone biosynthesis C-methylase UbiE